jgi:hypothetical protein
LIDSHDASSVTFQIPHVGLLKQPSLQYRIDPSASIAAKTHYSKNRKLFSKISA